MAGYRKKVNPLSGHRCKCGVSGNDLHQDREHPYSRRIWESTYANHYPEYGELESYAAVYFEEKNGFWTFLLREGKLEKEDLENGKDMLSRWMTIHYAYPAKLSSIDVIVHLSTSVFAGSDKTVIPLRAIVYFLRYIPKTMNKLIEEIDDTGRLGQLESSYRLRGIDFIPTLPGCRYQRGDETPPVRRVDS